MNKPQEFFKLERNDLMKENGIRLEIDYKEIWSDFTPSYFNQGIHCPHSSLPVSIRRNGLIYDYISCDDAPFVNEKGKSFFERHVPSHVQFLEAGMFNNQKVYLFNVLNRIRCLDEKHSYFKRRPDHDSYWVVSKMVLNRDSIQDCPIFRVYGWEMLIVSDVLKSELELEGVQGIAFDPVESV